MKLAHVSNQHRDSSTDDCFVQVVAEAKGGSARTLVRCIYGATFHHVHPSSVREFYDGPVGSLALVSR